MPVDKNGVRADAIMDGNATFNRSNYGRLYEHYFNAASRDILIKLRNWIGIVPEDKYTQHRVEECYHSNRGVFDQCWDYLMGYYEILQPIVYYELKDQSDEVKINHLAYITNNKEQAIHLFLPTNNPVSYSHAVDEIEKRYPPLRDKVTFTHNGQFITSEEDVRIASLYVMLLEKTGDDWSATASGKLQLFGMLSQITRSDKFSSPIRGQALRGIGEAEGRNLVSYTGQEPVAEFMDRNNNPTAHKQIVRKFLKSEKPTNIDRLVDRNEIPFGGAKPIQIIKHVALCAGWKFRYTPDPFYK